MLGQAALYWVVRRCLVLFPIPCVDHMTGVGIRIGRTGTNIIEVERLDDVFRSRSSGFFISLGVLFEFAMVQGTYIPY